MREVGTDQYAVMVEVGVAFLKLKFEVAVQIVESEPPVQLKAKISGKPVALAGQLTMATDLTLAEISADRTTIAYTVDLSITGKLGSIGQPAFRAKAEEMGQLFARNLKAALEGKAAEVVA